MECLGEGEAKIRIPWWWNDDVQKAIKEKKDCFRRLYLDRSAHNIEKYKMAKKAAKRAVGEARGRAREKLEGDGREGISSPCVSFF